MDRAALDAAAQSIRRPQLSVVGKREATASTSLSDGEIDQLALAAERIRPNVLLVACASKGFLIVTPGITIRDRLRVLLPSDTLPPQLV